MAMVDEISPEEILALLQADLADRKVEVQLEAIRELKTVAQAIGPELTRTKLMEIIESYCGFTNVPSERPSDFMFESYDEVLREIARVLNSEIVDLLGGGEHALPVIVLLQKLAMLEETVIRESAMDSMIECSRYLDKVMVDQQVLPLVAYLSEAEWWTSRVSAANCYPRLFELLGSETTKQAAQETIIKLCKDEMPMVRQEVYGNIPKMVSALGKDNIQGLLNFVTLVLKCLGKELQETMRGTMVDLVEALILCEKKCEPPNKQLRDTCEEYLQLVVNDGNWRVRMHFLERLIQIGKNSRPEFLNAYVLPGLVRRLEDAESGVRVKAIESLPEFFALEACDTKKVNEVINLDLIRKLVNDEFPEVRDAMSGSLLSVFDKLRANGNDVHTDEICEMLKQFQQDESALVRKNFCSHIDKAYEIVGEQKFCAELLPLIVKLQEDTKWRVRHAVLINVPFIAKLAGVKQIGETTFHDMLLIPFRDPVCAIRNAVVELIPQLVDQMGAEWILERVFEVVVKDFYHSKSKYQFRIVPVRVAQSILLAVDPSQSPGHKKLMEGANTMLCNGCGDAISNVRLVAVQALMKFLQQRGPILKGFAGAGDIKQALHPLDNDVDHDVKYFGTIAKAAYQKAMEM